MDQKAALRLQNELQAEIKKYEETRAKLNTLLSSRAKLLAQQHENEMVKTELDGLEEDEGVVYKLIGPVLVKVETEEAKNNVTSRLKWFTQEMYTDTRHRRRDMH